MADKKISALTGATTPLAGTEVLPIVQSGATVKVAVSDLTAGRSTSGTSFVVTGSTVPANGIYLPAANSVGIATNTTNAVTIDSSQNFLVKSTSTYSLPGSQSASVFTNTGYAVGNGTTSALFQDNKIAFNGANFYVINGNTTTGFGVYLVNGSVAWAAFSDERIKDIIEPITDAANKVSTLRAVIGKYKTDETNRRRSFLIAQDVQAVLPEAVDASNPERLGVQYTEVIPLLVAAIKEQQLLITALTTRITALER
jgi:hypothetical protein